MVVIVGQHAGCHSSFTCFMLSVAGLNLALNNCVAVNFILYYVRWQVYALLVILQLCNVMIISLAKRLDVPLSLLGHRPQNRKGPHLSRYKLVIRALRP